MENKMINWINSYIDKLKKEGKKETLKKIEQKDKSNKMKGVPGGHFL